jgi:polyprenyl-phospho-N-acetylgalactosaminyl synthase
MNGLDTASIFIIVPAYNEARVIVATLAPLIAAGYRVVVVDDCSRDGTWAILNQLPVTRLRHSINLGQGAALETGMEYARRCGAEIAVHFDADGQHDSEQIPAMVAPIAEGRADVVLGSRFLQESDVLRIPRTKRLVLRIGRIVSGLSTGVWLTDAHNGFRALSRKAMASVRLKENGYAHATEILEQVRRAGLRYIEVPTTIRYTGYSRSKGQPISNAVDITLDLIIRKLFS